MQVLTLAADLLKPSALYQAGNLQTNTILLNAVSAGLTTFLSNGAISSTATGKCQKHRLTSVHIVPNHCSLLEIQKFSRTTER